MTQSVLTGARLYAEARERANQLEVISEVGRIVNSTHEMPAMLRAVARALERVIPYRRVNFAFYDESTHEIVQHHVFAGEGEMPKEPLRLPAERTMSWRIMQDRRTVVIPDTRESEIPRIRELEAEGVLAVAGVPMLRDGRCLGVLNVDAAQTGIFSPGHIAFLESMCDHLAIAVDNARLFLELEWELSERQRTEAALRASEERYRRITEVSNEGICVSDAEGVITFVNARMSRLLGHAADELIGTHVLSIVSPEDHALAMANLERRRNGISDRFDMRLRHKDGSTRWVILSASPIFDEAYQYVGTVAMFTDISERKRAEDELRQSQKLESVGRLAAGIAHEINTPIQFVGDNTRFLRDSFAGLAKLIDAYRDLREAAERGRVDGALLAEIREAEEAADLEYLSVEVPRAIEQTLDGVDRVARIVRAMKDFAHSDLGDMAAADINQGLLSTLVVATNELKYVADVETDLGDLPPVICRLDDLNQVFLNLLVNGAHAIADVKDSTGERGVIRVTSRQEGGDVVIAISDTGAGIPEEIRGKIFDQFFTTKEVGPATGQGLALARSVVVDKYGGSLTFETEVGRGTTFYVRIPVDGGVLGASDEAA